MIKAGIFDVGGVLLPEVTSDIVYADILKMLNIEKYELFYQHSHELWSQMAKGKITEDMFWNYLTKRLKLKLPSFGESPFVKAYRTRSAYAEGVFKVLRILKKSKLKLAVLSNAIEPLVTYYSRQGLYDLFDIKIVSNEVGMTKPDPRIYKLVLEKLKIKPREGFFVDDRQPNVDAAKRLGIHAFIFQGTDKLKKDLRSIGIKLLP